MTTTPVFPYPFARDCSNDHSEIAIVFTRVNMTPNFVVSLANWRFILRLQCGHGECCSGNGLATQPNMTRLAPSFPFPV